MRVRNRKVWFNRGDEPVTICGVVFPPKVRLLTADVFTVGDVKDMAERGIEYLGVEEVILDLDLPGTPPIEDPPPKPKLDGSSEEAEEQPPAGLTKAQQKVWREQRKLEKGEE